MTMDQAVLTRSGSSGLPAGRPVLAVMGARVSTPIRLAFSSSCAASMRQMVELCSDMCASGMGAAQAHFHTVALREAISEGRPVYASGCSDSCKHHWSQGSQIDCEAGASCHEHHAQLMLCERSSLRSLCVQFVSSRGWFGDGAVVYKYRAIAQLVIQYVKFSVLAPLQCADAELKQLFLQATVLLSTFQSDWMLPFLAHDGARFWRPSLATRMAILWPAQ